MSAHAFPSISLVILLRVKLLSPGWSSSQIFEAFHMQNPDDFLSAEFYFFPQWNNHPSRIPSFIRSVSFLDLLLLLLASKQSLDHSAHDG